MQFFQRFCFLMLVVLSSQVCLAQQSEFQEWLRDFQKAQSEQPTEKAFLHLDKSEYTLGETIWMKSYLVAGAGHIPSPFSKNLYVELVNEEGEIKERLNLRSEEGLSKGSLAIQKDMAPGFYYLRAYTNWMKNQPTDFFFNKKIKIHSLKEGELMQERVVAQEMQMSFFPEGGDMISGIAARVAFEIEGISTDKLPLSGKIFNDKDEEVAALKTSHQGKGIFVLLPKSTGHYAKIDGFDTKFQLPAPKESGIALSVNNQADDFLNILIKSNLPYAGSTYYLLVHTRGYITYASEVTLKGARGFARVDKSTLPDGISHITLFDSCMVPIAERLVFVNNGQELNIQVSTKDPSYTTRDLATIDIKVSDNDGKPVQGSFSMSVFDANLVQNDQLDYSIKANLLLTSDLKGYIKNPSQYLKNDEESKRHVDLLMMVNGWRRFNWATINSATDEPLYAFEQSIELIGSMTKKNGSVVKGGRVLLLNAGQKAKAPKFVATDETGSFRFDNLHFYDTTGLILQGFQKNQLKNISFNIDGEFEKLALNGFSIDPAIDNPARISAMKKLATTAIFIDSTYRKENDEIYLDDVYVTASKQEERYRTLNSQYGKGEAYLNFSKIPEEFKVGRDPFAMMLGRIAGFSLSNPSNIRSSSAIKNSSITGNGSTGGGRSTGNGGQNAARLQGAFEQPESDPLFRKPTLRQGPYQGSPIILIDNVQVPFKTVYDLRASEIDYVEVYKSASAAMFGVKGSNGAIAIYTLKGGRMNKNLDKRNFEVLSEGGYHASREFYAPKYDNTNKQKFIPDERSTLFWAPMITTDANGKATVEFYTHDKNTNVFIDIQGISKNGITGTGVSRFNIRKNL